MSKPTYEKVLPALYEGKASILYAVQDDPELLIIQRKDDITAGNGAKHDVIRGKGAYCNKISNILFQVIQDDACYACTHFQEELNDTTTLARKLTPIKLEVVVRNIATGSIVKRLPFDDGQELSEPVLELYYKDDAAGDPFLNETEAVALGILNDVDEYEEIRDISLEIDEILQEFLTECGITLVDFKIEFGRDDSGTLYVIDEISPDTCRLWDTATGRKLDKDLYREGADLKTVFAAYQEVYRRLIANFTA